MKPVTRRSLIGALAAAPAILKGAPATAFCLAGDRYHNIDYIRIALGKTLGRDLGLSIDFSDELKSLHTAQLSKYKLLIVLRDGMTWPDGYADNSTYAGWVRANAPLVSEPPLPKSEGKPHYWITPAQGKAVKDFAHSGGGVLLLHNVTYISPHNDDFKDVLGAVTEGHPPIRKFKVKVTNHSHPITEGVKDFVVTDEQHYMKYLKDPKHLLLESENEDGLTFKDLGTKSAAGWAYDYGKGRVCYLAPGHMITALWNPEYEKLQKNAARWLLRNKI